MRVYFLFVALCLFITVHAQNTFLNIHLKTGTFISIPVENTPKITFEDGMIMIGTESIQVSNVLKYTLGTNMEDGMDNVAADNALQIDAKDIDKGIIVADHYNGQDVRLYNTNGVEFTFRKTVNDRQLIADISALPAGIYLLSVGKETIKIQKR